MAQSLEQVANVVEALRRRVETLEAALKRLELPVGDGPPAFPARDRTTQRVSRGTRTAAPARPLSRAAVTAVLGIDLASARWTFNGSALVHFHAESRVFTRVISGAIAWPESQAPLTPLTPQALAGAIHAFALREHVRAVALDGPHAWRNPLTAAHEPGVGRRCEYLCRTQGKTGVYPRTYPGNQFAWINFCVQVFDALLAQPGVRMADAPSGEAAPAGDGYVVLECFPTSLWRASRLAPLPAKGKKPDVRTYYQALAAAYALPPVLVTSHDDLQAIVAALAGVGATGGPVQARPRGVPCWMAEHPDGLRRVEGFIWDASPLRASRAGHCADLHGLRDVARRR